MVDNISNFCLSIICAIMMIIILEMIMPEGKSKKYVTFVFQIVITMILLEPITNLFDINIDEVLAKVTSEYEEVKYDENLYNDSVKKSYEQTLINDIVNRLNENGYSVDNVTVEYDDETLKPIKIYMDLIGESGFVQPVKIEVSSKGENIVR